MSCNVGWVVFHNSSGTIGAYTSFPKSGVLGCSWLVTVCHFVLAKVSHQDVLKFCANPFCRSGPDNLQLHVWNSKSNRYRHHFRLHRTYKNQQAICCEFDLPSKRRRVSSAAKFKAGESLAELHHRPIATPMRSATLLDQREQGWEVFISQGGGFFIYLTGPGGMS